MAQLGFSDFAGSTGGRMLANAIVRAVVVNNSAVRPSLTKIRPVIGPLQNERSATGLAKYPSLTGSGAPFRSRDGIPRSRLQYQTRRVVYSSKPNMEISSNMCSPSLGSRRIGSLLRTRSRSSPDGTAKDVGKSSHVDGGGNTNDQRRKGTFRKEASAYQRR